MGVSNEELEQHKRDYETVTGNKVVHGFICPITLEDVPPEALCKGHVLNEAIDDASGFTVAQRADVDCHFGQTIEPEFIRFVNLRTKSADELLKTGEFTVTLPDGQRVGGFHPSKERVAQAARAKYQQVALFDAEGKVIASPFFRTKQMENKIYRQLQIEWIMMFTTSALLGTVLKSAYLAMFRLLGYRWIMTSTADKVRRHLEAFYRAEASKGESIDHFSDFTGAFNVFLADVPEEHGDTLKDGLFWLHFASDSKFPILFAQTCLFSINGKIITVTLPATEQDMYYFQAMQEYGKLLKDKSTPQSVHAAMVIDGMIHMQRNPLKITYKPNVQPSI
jgi:hypothetical protein